MRIIPIVSINEIIELIIYCQESEYIIINCLSMCRPTEKGVNWGAARPMSVNKWKVFVVLIPCLWHTVVDLVWVSLFGELEEAGQIPFALGPNNSRGGPVHVCSNVVNILLNSILEISFNSDLYHLLSTFKPYRICMFMIYRTSIVIYTRTSFSGAQFIPISSNTRLSRNRLTNPSNFDLVSQLRIK